MTKSEIPEYLDEEDAFLPKVTEALTHIFRQFDENKDDVLDLNELQNFVKATNGEELDEVSLEEIQENFDVDEKGNLTLRGFLEMYQLQTLSEPEETRRDLQKHGFNDSFELENNDKQRKTVINSSSSEFIAQEKL